MAFAIAAVLASSSIFGSQPYTQTPYDVFPNINEIPKLARRWSKNSINNFQEQTLFEPDVVPTEIEEIPND
ncbi:hypothetical protein HK096_004750, partial [Nowakowskiella sp. JEL0078]